MSQLIIIIFTTITTAIITSFSKTIFDKIFANYNPDRKKIITSLKQILIFVMTYGLIIANITFTTITYPKVDKNFVLMMCVNFSMLVLFVVASILSHISERFKKIMGKTKDRIDNHES